MAINWGITPKNIDIEIICPDTCNTLSYLCNLSCVLSNKSNRIVIILIFHIRWSYIDLCEYSSASARSYGRYCRNQYIEYFWNMPMPELEGVKSWRELDAVAPQVTGHRIRYIMSKTAFKTWMRPNSACLSCRFCCQILVAFHQLSHGDETMVE